MTTFSGRAAHSVDHMCSLYFDYLLFELSPVLVLKYQGQDFENNGHIHVYSPEITPVGYLFCKNIKHLSISSFVANFSN